VSDKANVACTQLFIPVSRKCPDTVFHFLHLHDKLLGSFFSVTTDSCWQLFKIYRSTFRILI